MPAKISNPRMKHNFTHKYEKLNFSHFYQRLKKCIALFPNKWFTLPMSTLNPRKGLNGLGTIMMVRSKVKEILLKFLR